MDRIFERIVDLQNLRSAFDSLWERHHPPDGQQTNFHPGPDSETLDQFIPSLEDNLLQVRESLRCETFSFGPYFERIVLKDEGERRLIARFNLRDRIILRAMHQIIAPLFDRKFSDSLVSYRRGLGAWDAVLKAVRMVRREGRLWVFKTDIRKYAEGFDHGIRGRV